MKQTASILSLCSILLGLTATRASANTATWDASSTLANTMGGNNIRGAPDTSAVSSTVTPCSATIRITAGNLPTVETRITTQ